MKKELIKKILTWIACAILTIVIILQVIKITLFSQVVVSGNSMNPTLSDADLGYALRVNGDAERKVKRFDIVTFDTDVNGKDMHLIKRIIGLPGETIKFDKDCNLYVNNVLIEQNFIDEEIRLKTFNHVNYNFKIDKDIEIEKNHYFVLGDNRDNSTDCLHGLKQVESNSITSILKVITSTCDYDEDGKVKNKKFTGYRFY